MELNVGITLSMRSRKTIEFCCKNFAWFFMKNTHLFFGGLIENVCDDEEAENGED